MKKRRRKFRRVRYVARPRRAKRNPSVMTLGLLAGGGLLAYLLYKKWKEKKAALPAPKPALTISGTKGGVSVNLGVGDSWGGVLDTGMKSVGGILASSGSGSLG